MLAIQAPKPNWIVSSKRIATVPIRIKVSMYTWGFDHVNTAAYSPRPNTPAATWPNQLSEEIKIQRLKAINFLVEKTAKEKNLRYKGSLQEILIENINPKDSSQLMWRTRTNRLTFFPRSSNNGKLHQPGEIVKTRINDIRPFSLTGTLI